MANITYLGGGNMARGMAHRLLAAGHNVTIYNRTQEKLASLRTAGASVAATPRQAVKDSTIIFSSVTDDAASRAVWLGADGALAANLPVGTLLVEHSTLSRDWVLELSKMVMARGLRYVDCPVAGRPDAAAAGQLFIFAGAEKADLDEVTPYIVPISKEIFHFGMPGAGTAFKLIYNLMGVVQIVALAEGLAAAEAAAIDPLIAVRAFSRCNTGSPHVVKHGPVMANGNHENPPGFTAKGRVKDSSYGVSLEAKLIDNPRVGRAALAAFQEMVDLGWGDRADTLLIDVIRGKAGAPSLSVGS